LNSEVVVKVRIAVVALAAVAVLGACEKESETKGGTVKPVSSSESTATTATSIAPSTTVTTAKATTTTTAKATTSTTARPTTTTTEAPATPTTAATTVSYANCSAAKAAGVAPLHRGDPGYASKLDRDGDGIACES
jgi:excalibur calcium-binding domain-containing protein